MRYADGKEAIEYGLLLAIIVVVTIGALTTIGGNISSFFLSQDIVGKENPLFSLLDPSSTQNASGLPGSGDRAGNPNSYAALGSEAAGLSGTGTITTSAQGMETEMLIDALADVTQADQAPDRNALSLILGPQDWEEVTRLVQEIAHECQMIDQNQEIIAEKLAQSNHPDIQNNLDAIEESLASVNSDHQVFVEKMTSLYETHPLPATAPPEIIELATLVDVAVEKVTTSAEELFQDVAASGHYDAGSVQPDPGTTPVSPASGTVTASTGKGALPSSTEVQQPCPTPADKKPSRPSGYDRGKRPRNGSRN